MYISPLYPSFNYENDELFKKEVESYVDTTDLFVGTLANHEREVIKPILEKYNKLLFVVTSWEGSYYHDNIVFFGRFPQYYAPQIAVMNLIQRNYALVITLGYEYLQSVSFWIYAFCGMFSGNCYNEVVNSTNTIEVILDKYVNDNILEDENPENSYTIYTYVGKEKAYEINRYLNASNALDKYYMYIMDGVESDYQKSFANGDKLYGNVFFHTSYLYSLDTAENILMKQMIDNKHGEPKYVMSEVTVSLYYLYIIVIHLLLFTKVLMKMQNQKMQLKLLNLLKLLLKQLQINQQQYQNIIQCLVIIM